MKTLRPLIALLLPLLAAACGEVPDSPDQTTTLARVKGSISNTQDLQVQGNLRMALIWRNLSNESTLSYIVAQDVDVAPQLPASFELSLNDAPPASVVSQVDKLGIHLRAAVGALVAYEDLNGNGKLDLVQQGDPAYIDRIVGNVGGQEPGTNIVWIESSTTQAQLDAAAFSDGSKPVLGYNLVVDEEQDGKDEQWKGLDYPITLSLDNHPFLQFMMCTKGYIGHAQPSPPAPTGGYPEGPGPSGQWPSSDDPSLSCHTITGEDPNAAPRPALSYESCTTTDEVCAIMQICVPVTYLKPADPAAAAGWPCP